MKHVLGEVWDAVRLTFSDFFRDHATRLSAALAFYTVFALAPMLVIVIAIAGRVFGADAVRGQVVGQFGSLIGEGPARQVEEMVVQASAPKTSLIATILGVATLLLGATGVFLQLKGALNAVWEVVPRTGGGILRMLRDRALALAMLMGVAFLLLVTLVLSAALAAVGEWAADLMPVSLPVLQIGNFLLSFLVITFLFGMIYKLLPDSKIAWKDVWVGAAVTSFLFSIGKTLIGLYLGRSSLSSVYGAAGSFAILLTWIYYSAAIFLLGAEFTQVYARKWGTHAVRAPGTRPRSEELHDGERGDDPGRGGRAEPPRWSTSGGAATRAPQGAAPRATQGTATRPTNPAAHGRRR